MIAVGIRAVEAVCRGGAQQVPRGVSLDHRVRIAPRPTGFRQRPDPQGQHHRAEGSEQPAAIQTRFPSPGRPPGQARLDRQGRQQGRRKGGIPGVLHPGQPPAVQEGHLLGEHGQHENRRHCIRGGARGQARHGIREGEAAQQEHAAEVEDPAELALGGVHRRAAWPQGDHDQRVCRGEPHPEAGPGRSGAATTRVPGDGQPRKDEPEIAQRIGRLAEEGIEGLLAKLDPPRRIRSQPSVRHGEHEPGAPDQGPDGDGKEHARRIGAVGCRARWWCSSRSRAGRFPGTALHTHEGPH